MDSRRLLKKEKTLGIARIVKKITISEKSEDDSLTKCE